VAGLPDLSALPDVAQAAARSSLGGALGVASSLPAGPGEALASAARAAYTDAMSLVFMVAATAVVATAVMVGRLYPRSAPVHQGPAAPAPGPTEAPERTKAA
jgi:DHA2 family multidrug resistance protein-like MFS transporter